MNCFQNYLEFHFFFRFVILRFIWSHFSVWMKWVSITRRVNQSLDISRTSVSSILKELLMKTIYFGHDIMSEMSYAWKIVSFWEKNHQYSVSHVAIETSLRLFMYKLGIFKLRSVTMLFTVLFWLNAPSIMLFHNC